MNNYCSNCGEPVTGNFCSNCGKAVQPHSDPAVEYVGTSYIEPKYDNYNTTSKNLNTNKSKGYLKYFAIAFVIVFALLFIAIIAFQQDNPSKKISGNANVTKQVSTVNQSTENSEAKSINESTEKESTGKELAIAVGDIIKTNDMEIEIKKIEFSYDVLPDDTSGLYTHYAADKGSVYIHIDTDVKNLAKQKLDCDKIPVDADYNNGFTYNSQPIPEDSSTGFTYANITSIDPLKKLGVHFIINCPQEVEESDNPLFITFRLYGTKDVYKYIIR